MNETTIHINHDIENIDQLIGKKVNISIEAVITGITINNNLITNSGMPVSSGKTTELRFVEFDTTIDTVVE